MGAVHAKEPFNETRRIDVEAPLEGNPPDGSSREDRAKGPEQKQINLEGIRARVDKINVDGLARTKDDIVIDTVKELFKATDFQDVIRETHRVRGRLESLGCFRNIGVYIDTSRGPEATPHGLEVTFHVKELKRVVGGVNTMVGNNEGSVVVGMRMPNLLGRGEKLQTEYSYGSKKTSGFHTALSKPLGGKLDSVVSGSVFQQGSEWPWSGYRQVERGVLLDLGFVSAPAVKHNLQWEGCWREMATISRAAAFDVREQAGPSLKSAVRHILSVDRRDGGIFPTSGTLVQLTTELAGLGGNVGFLKNDLLVQGNWPVFRDCVFQAAVQGGYLRRLDNDKTVGLCDQFYLGGPLSLRGFQTRGVGPHSDGFSLGSDMYWAGAVHLYTPLPFRPGRGGFGDLFRTHLFCNFGNIGTFKFTDDYAHNVRELRRNVRLAYGLGVALRLGQMARVELNYCFPAMHARGDETNPGVQFGVGVHFL